jgi:hemerythrin-like domain-containing protein
MKDKNHVEMEDISIFSLEKSLNHKDWEDVSYSELKEQELKDLEEEKMKCFLRVVRSGSPFKLGRYFYRIKASY